MRAVEIRKHYERLLLRKAKSWFTGYNENVEGHNRMRYMMYNGGLPRYRKQSTRWPRSGYVTLALS